MVDGNNPAEPELFNEVFMFGGRGISAYKVDPITRNMTLAWDSGDVIEKEIERFFPKIFNGAAFSRPPNQVKPFMTKDSRSSGRVRTMIAR